MIGEKKIDLVGIQEMIKPDFTKNELHNLSGGETLSGNGPNQEVDLVGFW